MTKDHGRNKYNQICFKREAQKGKISVIIPVYKDARGLTDTLQSLQKQTLPKKQYEVIVANDGGSEEVSKVCNKYKVKEVTIIPNKGSYNARNTALVESSGEYLAFTDADVKVPSDWLETGIKYLQKYDYIGGPIKIDQSKVKTIAHKYELYNAFDVESYYTVANYFPTANMFTHRQVIDQTGGFDKRLFSSGDKEFGDRITDADYKTNLIEQLQVIHPPRNLKQIINKMNRVESGKKNLYTLFPERFPDLKTDIFNEIRYAIFNKPGIGTSNGEKDIKLQMMTFKYFLQYVYLFNRIKYYI